MESRFPRASSFLSAHSRHGSDDDYSDAEMELDIRRASRNMDEMVVEEREQHRRELLTADEEPQRDRSQILYEKRLRDAHPFRSLIDPRAVIQNGVVITKEGAINALRKKKIPSMWLSIVPGGWSIFLNIFANAERNGYYPAYQAPLALRQNKDAIPSLEGARLVSEGPGNAAKELVLFEVAGKPQETVLIDASEECLTSSQEAMELAGIGHVVTLNDDFMKPKGLWLPSNWNQKIRRGSDAPIVYTNFGNSALNNGLKKFERRLEAHSKVMRPGELKKDKRTGVVTFTGDILMDELDGTEDDFTLKTSVTSARGPDKTDLWEYYGTRTLFYLVNQLLCCRNLDPRSVYRLPPEVTSSHKGYSVLRQKIRVDATNLKYSGLPLSAPQPPPAPGDPQVIESGKIKVDLVREICSRYGLGILGDAPLRAKSQPRYADGLKPDMPIYQFYKLG